MPETPPVLLTIGHSNHSAEHFQALLDRHGVQFLVDVRSWPHSRYVEWADQAALPDLCAVVQTRYLFLGDLLGGRPDGPQFYDADGHVLYGKVAETEGFKRGIARLRHGLEKSRIAIMCSEEDPEHCHRRLLVAKVMIEEGCAVSHIRGNGTIEVERGIDVASQESLFGEEASRWRSSLSVSRKRRPNTFSTA